MEYTKDEIKDITDREKKCLAFLKEMDMTPAAQVYNQNIGNDMFVHKVTCYLADTRYDKSPKKSPETSEKPVETVSTGN